VQAAGQQQKATGESGRAEEKTEGGDGAQPAQAKAKEASGRAMVSEVLGESYKVRIGDLTPFEEQRLAAAAAAATASSGAALPPPPAAVEAQVERRQGGGSGSGSGSSGKRRAGGEARGGDGRDSGKRPNRSQPPPRSGPSSSPAQGNRPERRERPSAASASASGTGGQRPKRPDPPTPPADGDTVVCPVCNRDVTVKDPKHPDRELNDHLDRCMRRKPEAPEGGRRAGASSASSGGGSGRRSSRLRGGDMGEDEGKGAAEDQRPRCRGRYDEEFIDVESSGSEYGPDDGLDEEEDDDDDVEQDMEVDEEGGGGSQAGRKSKAAGKEGKTGARQVESRDIKQRGHTTLVEDDMVEEDYRRRLREYEELVGEEDYGDDDDDDDSTVAAREEGQGAGGRHAPMQLGGGFKVEARINRRLYWYQRTGIRWLWELHQQGAGGILGDEMGLGKTVQLAAFLGGMGESGRLHSAVIVTPATLLAQWTLELNSWAPKLRVVVLHKSGQAFGAQPPSKVQKFIRRAISIPGVVCITTYESLKIYRNLLLQHRWTYAVLDEGQKIRNPDADITVTAKQLQTIHRIILSGTPIQNNLRELWSLFDFVFPGRLGTLPAFDMELATPIRLGGYSNASPTMVHRAYRCAVVLRDLINPYLLRRMKKDIMEILPMPPKTEQVLFCKLTRRQRLLYREVLASPEVRLILEGKARHFRTISTLRKLCNHPDLVTPPGTESDSLIKSIDIQKYTMGDDEEEEEEDEMGVKGELPADFGNPERAGKMLVLEEVLPTWHKQGHRVLLFSQTRQVLNILEAMVRSHGWRYFRMDGNTSVSSRAGMIQRFNVDASIFVFLLTTRTGGLGINLTGADRVVLYDPDWNPQTDIQARERAWRLGQKRPVTIYRLVTSGAIEEKIYQRQIFKVPSLFVSHSRGQ
jgi:DNA excision repair protein ERCC-6